jgi:Carboxypeptidase regulatory-like domain
MILTRNQEVTHDVLTHVILSARFAVLIVVTELMVACGSQRPLAGPPASLVTGMVAAGPVAPVARPGMPATRAVPGATVEALRENQVMATAYTDKTGRFELTLQPGTYLIRAQSDKYLSRQTSKTVTLSGGKHLTINLVLDTGIR